MNMHRRNQMQKEACNYKSYEMITNVKLLNFYKASPQLAKCFTRDPIIYELHMIGTVRWLVSYNYVYPTKLLKIWFLDLLHVATDQIRSDNWLFERNRPDQKYLKNPDIQSAPKHDMKENAPNSKIVDNLNVTAPRTSKRQPLQDLRKN
ncbi:hypothetical protein YC2023_076407 [Brassica napus]